MGYANIQNLYRAQEILLFKRCFAMEKIHGTSAHLSWNNGKLGFFSGGEKHEKFVALFDQENLIKVFTNSFGTDMKVMVYGEAYGGKQQGMSKTYGPNLKFIVFDVLLTSLEYGDTIEACPVHQEKQSVIPTDLTTPTGCVSPATEKNASKIQDGWHESIGEQPNTAKVSTEKPTTEPPVETGISGQSSVSLLKSSTLCLPDSKDCALSAENQKPGETKRAESPPCVSTIATAQDRSEVCFAINVTSPSEPPKAMMGGLTQPVCTCKTHNHNRRDLWLAVPKAEKVASDLGLEFVHYVEIPTDIAEIDAQRDADSVQAIRNGMGPGHMREGVVLRPPVEVTLNNGMRVICKHKREEFSERAHVPKVADPAKLAVMTRAQEVADEWVVPMRLEHILQEHPDATGIEHTGEIVRAMIQDVRKESKGEIAEGREIDAAIGRRAAELWKRHLKSKAGM
jgi:hypothetical protein